MPRQLGFRDEISDNELDEFDAIADNENEERFAHPENNLQNIEIEMVENELIEEGPEEEDSDDELLSKLKNRLDGQRSAGNSKQKTWEEMGQFVPMNFEFTFTEPTFHERERWKVEDYIKVYFDDSDFENICNCTNVKYLEEIEKPLNPSTAETKIFFGIAILKSYLKYPQIKMYWAKMTRVNTIARAMTHDRFFQIRNHLKFVIDADISETVRKEDKHFKIHPLHESIKRDVCHSLGTARLQ
ncbi:hypothetical protein NQ314_010177 [Rhamnusium bicolor]|uniref:PiggyBac transposable element-derived protein domain-containing protein n=1 Tax=Rhamnusium bicolor TaxID=1586634 RepID=A0AAV8XTK7_9CUCU|nr:hypothetical protein NQ314_010177 [Rhamnusium bicolor]